VYVPTSATLAMFPSSRCGLNVQHSTNLRHLNSKREKRGTVQLRLMISIISALLLISCGGGDSSSNNGGNGGGGGGGNGQVQTPTVVSVAEGQTASGVNITVPTGTPAINAEVLGVTGTSGGRAQNTGDRIQQGTTGRVLMFGKGLSGSLDVTISGPADIQISNIVSRTATDGTAGLSFDVTVAADAALGARTVYLRSSSDQITSFTGGLEVIP
jgi:hypothetical protein